MPASTPIMPQKFYSDDFATNHCCLSDNPNQDYYLTVRAGYQHAGYGDNSDSWYGGVKFYAQPEALRSRAGKNAWLIPDMDAEFSHQYLAKPDGTGNPGSGEGIQFRANIYWPWVNWTTHVMARENCICPLSKPLNFAFGPIFVTGFDKTFDGSGFRFARYGGARLSINRYAFLEYVFGDTDGLQHSRQEILSELPFYMSRDSRVRYVFRGEWSRGDHNLPDYYQLGAFVEMPLGLLTHPDEWHDLIPFAK